MTEYIWVWAMPTLNYSLFIINYSFKIRRDIGYPAAVVYVTDN